MVVYFIRYICIGYLFIYICIIESNIYLVYLY